MIMVIVLILNINFILFKAYKLNRDEYGHFKLFTKEINAGCLFLDIMENPLIKRNILIE